MRKKVYAKFKLLSLTLVLALPVSVSAQEWNYRTGYSSNTSGGDRANATATDAAGNVYVAGNYIGSINFGTGDLPLNDASNGFIAKFSPSGTCLWAVGFASAFNDQANSIATDGNFVYVGGFFNTSITLPPVTATGTSATGFIAKLSAATGLASWISTIGGTGTENVESLCLDPSGNVYASGNFITSATFGAFTRTANGGSSSDMFVTKLNPADGSFAWASTGGALSNTDFTTYSGIAFVPALNEVVVTGGYNAATATYATIAPAVPSSVQITNAGSLDIAIIEVNASDGAFINAIGVGGAGEDNGISLTYDAFTGDVMITGYYASPTITFGDNPPLTNEGGQDVWYTRFNPAANTFAWSRSAGGTGGVGSSTDRPYDIASNNTGGVYVLGTFRGTFDIPTTLPTPLVITNTNAADDIFLTRINAADGNGQLVAQGASPAGATVSDIGYAAAVGTSNNLWVVGTYNNPITFAPLAPLPVSAMPADIFIARYTDPAPLTVTPSQTPPNCSVGCDGTATVTPSGGVAPYTYTWTPNVSATNTATGLCPGATLSVTVKDALGSSVTQNFTITPASQLPNTATSNTGFSVSATNTYIFDAGCNLICRVQPDGGGNQVSGTVAAKVWIDPSVKTFTYPYVQRHYEIAPATNAANATARITLYFTQQEFNTFNAFPGVTALLPTGPSDAAGKANVRFSKFSGTSGNGSGAPGSYPATGAIVMDPADADIVWNATASRWEISLNVTGFSGFFLQTSLAVLPLHWLSFNGSINAAGKAAFNWKVQEQQVAGYTVEKSTDGEHYVAIGNLPSQGDGEHTYEFTEAAALAGKATYRIKQTDFDGRGSYSQAIQLRSDREGWVNLYPNPVQRSATLNVTDKALLNTTAVLYDGTGREMQRIRIAQSVTTLYLDNYVRGVYTLRFSDGRTIRIVKE